MTNAKRAPLITDFSVGFVLFLATLAVMVTVFFVGGGGPLLGGSSTYLLAVPYAQGVSPGSPVSVSGVRVGVVESIDLIAAEKVAQDSAGVLLRLSITRKYRDRIRENSVAWLQTAGLLGDTVINIGYGSAEAPALAPGKPITYKPKPLLADLAGEELTESTEDLLRTVTKLLNDLNAGTGTLGQLLKNQELYTRVSELTTALTATGQELEGVAREVKGILVEVREKRGTLGKLVSDPQLYDEAVATVQRTQKLLAAMESGEGILARLTRDRETAERFDSILENIDTSSAKLNQLLALLEGGRGSLAMLLHDPSLATGLRNVILGVQEYGVVENVIRNAESAGHKRALQNLDPVRQQREELQRLRNVDRFRGAGIATENIEAVGGDVKPAIGKPEGDPRDGTGQESQDTSPKETSAPATDG